VFDAMILGGKGLMNEPLSLRRQPLLVTENWRPGDPS
jgi:hypothetical protein